MESSNPWSFQKKLAVSLILCAGVFFAWRTTREILRMTTHQQMMAPSELRGMFERSEIRDRANWDAMWDTAGKKAPNTQDELMEKAALTPRAAD